MDQWGNLFVDWDDFGMFKYAERSSRFTDFEGGYNIFNFSMSLLASYKRSVDFYPSDSQVVIFLFLVFQNRHG